jgi:ribonuclease HI
MEAIVVYTDGAALGNPGPGGYGVVMFYGKFRKELSGGFRHTTNNRMELLAVIQALKNIQNNTLPVHVYTDSKYVCDAISKKWVDKWARESFKKAKNEDLWKEYLLISKKFTLTLHWVKGHAGIVENERCDFLATEAAKAHPTAVDNFYENLNPL